MDILDILLVTFWLVPSYFFIAGLAFFIIPPESPEYWMAAVPFVGMVCLVLGLSSLVSRPDPWAAFLLLPVLLSHLLVGIAGHFEGQVTSHVEWIGFAFAVVEICLVLLAIVRARASALALVPLSVFVLSYATVAYVLSAIILGGSMP